jgi:hypothetical protein
MQSHQPIIPFIYLQDLLQRIEGDYDFARMCYNDMKACEIYQNSWRMEGKALKEAYAGQKFLSKLQGFKESGGKDGKTE